MVLVWRKCKNVALLYVENLDVIRTIRRLYKHDDLEVVDMEPFKEKKNKAESHFVKKIPPRKSWAYKVRCVETNEEWDSIAECCRATGAIFFTISKACRTGMAVDGRHYVIIKDE